MTKHSSDFDSHIFNISYLQMCFYLKAHGWVHDKTIDNIDIYTLDVNNSSCRLLLPQDDQSEEYKHRLIDILLILQLLQSPSLKDIHWQIKKFCMDFVTQDQVHE